MMPPPLTASFPPSQPRPVPWTRPGSPHGIAAQVHQCVKVRSGSHPQQLTLLPQSASNVQQPLSTGAAGVSLRTLSSSRVLSAVDVSAPTAISARSARDASAATPTADAMQPWLEAARDFEMNTDFDMDGAVRAYGRPLQLLELLNLMKAESKGKRTIQVLGDKIALSRVLDNLQLPQMPLLFVAQGEVARVEVDTFVEDLQSRENGGEDAAFDVVIKPTHLSNAAGTIIFSKGSWERCAFSAEKLHKHMVKFLADKPSEFESEALKSLKPGFIVQPRYRSVTAFTHPLELRVITLWGRARLGIWWWGRKKADDPTRKSQRNVWVVRKVLGPRLSDGDEWQVVHEHQGGNEGFDVAVEILRRAMPAAAAAAEALAQAVGAPFLRSDFFAGSETWGVRMNEVAYCSGLDYRQVPRRGGEQVDDGPSIAAILQQGSQLCRRRAPPECFLSRLGAEGSTYESMVVEELPPERRLNLAVEALARAAATRAAGLPPPVSLSRCETPRGKEDDDRDGAVAAAARPAQVSMPATAPAAAPIAAPVAAPPVRAPQFAVVAPGSLRAVRPGSLSFASAVMPVPCSASGSDGRVAGSGLAALVRPSEACGVR